MPVSRLRPAFIFALFSLFVLAGCADSEKAAISGFDSDEGILRFVPADTPYLVATPGNVPDELMDKLEPQLDIVLKAYYSILRAMVENAYAEARESEADLSSFEKALPVVDELESLMSLEGLRGAGIARNADVAVYGVGLLPVFRLSLTEGELFDAVIARMEDKASQEMPRGTIDGHSYRYVGDDEGRLVVAVIDNDLVVAVVPSALSDDLLKQVLGLTLPDHNIADSGALGELAGTYGLTDYLIGVFDIERITKTFLEAPTGINAELLALAKYDDSELSDVCKTEILSLAGVMPRIVFGYTELNVRKMSSKMVIELRDDIAAGVSTLTGAVPGLATPHDGLFSIGMSADLLAARAFYSERLDAIEADPFECELFAEFQEGVVAGREALNKPVPPVIYGFKGFLAVIQSMEGMDLANNVPPTSIDMQLLLAMDNAESLIAMGAMFSPELAALNVEADGDPVRLTMPQIDASGLDVFVALTANGLGVSVGEGMHEGLADLMSADVPEPSPFLVADMDTERYYAFLGDVIAAQQDSGNEFPELQEAVATMTESIRKMMDRVRLVVNFTENGIEVDSSVQLAE